MKFWKNTFVFGLLMGTMACSQNKPSQTEVIAAVMLAHEQQNYTEARKLLLPLAKDSNSSAQFMLAEYYIKGKGGTVDDKEGLKWLDKAAQNGHTRAQSMIGVRYINGKGVEENLGKGVAYLKQAADKNNAKSQLLMGFLYVYGKGVPKDLTLASRYYYAASANGNAEATKRLSSLAQEGTAEAQFLLGRMYKDGADGVTQAPDKAAKLVLSAAQKNHAGAQFLISQAYGTGQGFEQDYLSAHMWANLAAAGGHAEAVKRRDTWSQLMTPEQIATAQTMARNWTAAFENPQE